MIDYQKLKQAHQLCDKLPFQVFSFDLWYRGYAPWYVLTFEDLEGLTHELEGEDIDKVIAKLQELTQPHKYKVGQKIWYLNADNQIESFIIDKIEYAQDKNLHQCLNIKKGWWIYETEAYPSREALIDAQIEYWSCLKNEKISTQSGVIST